MLETLTSCQATIEGCGTPLTESSSRIMDEVIRCKAAAENLIAGLLWFFFNAMYIFLSDPGPNIVYSCQSLTD